MNKKIEKWLMTAALGSWVASIGALVAIDVVSSYPLDELALQVPWVKSQTLQTQQSFQSVPIENVKLYRMPEAGLSLQAYQNHWLDAKPFPLGSGQTLLDPEKNITFSGLDKRAVQMMKKIQMIGDHNAKPIKSRVARTSS